METNSSFELILLRRSGDGFMDSVHAMRDAVGADVVHLIERWGVDGTGEYCGIAYVMEDVNQSFQEYAFGATEFSCGSAVLAHELGHNMGLNHDRYAADVDLTYGLTNEPYACAYGYVNQEAFAAGAASSKRWRTIMAYDRQCFHSGIDCGRVGRFSNPAQTYSGSPLGVWRNADASVVSGPADASSTLNETRATVAAFRSRSPAPQIVSLRRRQPAEEMTNSASLLWRLAFSRDVKNVTGDDFVLSGSGLGTTPLSVTAKTGSQRIYDMVVASGLGDFDGEVTLGFASGQDINSLSGVALFAAWPAHAERTYTLDHTAPTPSISPSSAGSSPFVATVRFAEDVTGFGDAADVAATNATVTAPSCSDARTCTVQVTPTTAVAATITLSVPAGAAADVAGNASVAGSQAVAYDASPAASLTVGGLSDGSVAENAQWTSGTPTVTGSPSGALTWTKEGADAGHFSIISTTGVLRLPGQNYEESADADGDNEYEVTARATDTRGNSASARVTVMVTDATESRSVWVDRAFSKKIPEGFKYAETLFLNCNSSCRVAGGAIGEVTWTKTGADAARFTLDTRKGALTLGPQDFENPADANQDNDYELTIEATDADGNSATKDVTVRVIKGPPGWLTISGLSSESVEENSAWTSGTPAVAGASGNVTWTKEGPDAARFSVDSGTGVLTMAARDYENPVDADGDNEYEVTVRATDQRGNSGAAPITVTITDSSDAPILSVDDGRVLESDGTLGFRVTRSRSSSSEVTVDYATSDGPGSMGARAGSDYTAASGTLTFIAGSSATQQIVVDILDDADDEEETCRRPRSPT